MPRPQRTRVAPSGPSQLPPQVRRTQPDSPRRVRSRQNPNIAKAAINDHDSDCLAPQATLTEKQRNPKSKDVFMRGALASTPDSAQSKQAQAQASRSTRDSPSRGTRNGVAGGLAAALTHSKDAAQPKANGFSLTNGITKAAETTSRKETGKMTPRSVTAPTIRGQSVQRKVQATPAADSSVVALARFKRRPRQPSLLNIGRQDDLSLSLSLESSSNALRLDDSFERELQSLEDMVPMAPEVQQNTPSVPSDSDSRLQTLSDSESSEATQSSRKRKTSPAVLEGFRVDEADDTDTEPELPPPKRRQVSPPSHPLSDSVTPPESSSPASQLPMTVLATFTQKKGARNATIVAKATSKSRRTRPKAGNEQALSTATLRDLLPRRRPQRASLDVMDVPSSESAPLESSPPTMGSNDDELSFAPTGRRGKPKKRSARQPLSSKSPNLASKARAARKARSPGRKQARHSQTYGRRGPNHDQENHSVDGISDSENQEHLAHRGARDSPFMEENGADSSETTSLPTMPPSAKKEVKQLRQKFRQIDEWALDFETVTASSSSPRDAR